MEKLLLLVLSIFIAITSIIFISDTVMWIFSGISLSDLLGWGSFGVLEHISNLGFSILALLNSYSLFSFISDSSQKLNWTGDMLILLVGLKMIVGEIYHELDGDVDTYINPIYMFFGVLTTATTIRSHFNMKNQAEEMQDSITTFDTSNQIDKFDE